MERATVITWVILFFVGMLMFETVIAMSKVILPALLGFFPS